LSAAICNEWLHRPDQLDRDRFVVVLYVGFSKALPNFASTVMYFAAPLLLEIGFRMILWRAVNSEERGLVHPRLYSAVDLFFSLIGAVTGPIKTVLRLLSAVFCLFFHLFRSDTLLMVDPRFVSHDVH
jgi:hypothetical protein